jgi:hypothetical protein
MMHLRFSISAEPSVDIALPTMSFRLTFLAIPIELASIHTLCIILTWLLLVYATA